MVKLTDPSLEDGNKNIFMYQVKILGLELYGLLCFQLLLGMVFNKSNDRLCCSISNLNRVFNTEILTNMELKFIVFIFAIQKNEQFFFS